MALKHSKAKELIRQRHYKAHQITHRKGNEPPPEVSVTDSFSFRDDSIGEECLQINDEKPPVVLNP